MTKEIIWHCPICHFTDCENSKKKGNKNHRSYRGIDIGECPGKMEMIICDEAANLKPEFFKKLKNLQMPPLK